VASSLLDLSVTDCQLPKSINFAPLFVKEPVQTVIEMQAAYIFSIPEFIDILEEEVSVEVLDLQKFMTYDTKT
jgi:hypothetical protein